MTGDCFKEVRSVLPNQENGYITEFSRDNPNTTVYKVRVNDSSIRIRGDMVNLPVFAVSGKLYSGEDKIISACVNQEWNIIEPPVEILKFQEKKEEQKDEKFPNSIFDDPVTD